MSDVTDIIIYGLVDKGFHARLENYLRTTYKATLAEISKHASGNKVCSNIHAVSINYFESLESFKETLNSCLPLKDDITILFCYEQYEFPVVINLEATE